MPRRDDIQSILIICAAPILIGQACEFDNTKCVSSLSSLLSTYIIVLQ